MWVTMMARSSSWNAEARYLSGLSESLVDKAEEVLTDTAEQTRLAAKARVPVRTGRLKASIRTQKTGPLRREVIADSLKSADESYAIWVEKGTSRMAPRPYMAPAVDAAEPNFFERVGDLIDGS